MLHNNQLTRDEHVTWCKKRALEYVDAGDLSQAYGSMVSDLRKHPATESHAGITLGLMLMMNNHLDTATKMREFIEGFN